MARTDRRGLSKAAKARGWLRCRSVHGDHTWTKRQYCYLYEVWRNIRKRCYDPKNPYYKHYGARGIALCAAWQDYSPFRIWAVSSGYRKGLQLDRIDNDGNYEPTNCQWVTHQQNNWNRRDTIMVEWEGKTVPLAKLAKQYGKTPALVNGRYKRGWHVRKCLTHPIRSLRRKNVIPDSKP